MRFDGKKYRGEKKKGGWKGRCTAMRMLLNLKLKLGRNEDGKNQGEAVKY